MLNCNDLGKKNTLEKKAASWNVTQFNLWHAVSEVLMFSFKYGSKEKQRENISARCENPPSSKWK
jgi:hypothetical protein